MNLSVTFVLCPIIICHVKIKQCLHRRPSGIWFLATAMPLRVRDPVWTVNAIAFQEDGGFREAGLFLASAV